MSHVFEKPNGRSAQECYYCKLVLQVLKPLSTLDGDNNRR